MKRPNLPLEIGIPAVTFGAIVMGLTYWLSHRGVYFSRLEASSYLGILAAAALGLLEYMNRPKRERMFAYLDEELGYWRLQVTEEDAVCFATSFQRYRIPKPHRESGIQVIGRIHCIVEDEFWVWREHDEPLPIYGPEDPHFP